MLFSFEPGLSQARCVHVGASGATGQIVFIRPVSSAHSNTCFSLDVGRGTDDGCSYCDDLLPGGLQGLLQHPAVVLDDGCGSS